MPTELCSATDPFRLYSCRVTRVFAAAAVLLIIGTVNANASAPIRPHQHFVGRVNGHGSPATVTTVCPGPSTGSTGPVAGGQTVEVRRVLAGGGYTGPFSTVYAWFVPAPGGPRPVQITVSAYATPSAIPTSVRVPCSGSGQVEFSSCPYLAPCAYGWQPTYVTVRFVDIAA